MPKRLAAGCLLAAILVLFAAVPRGSAADAYAREKVLLGPFGTVSRLSVTADFSDPDANARFEALWADVKALLWELDGLLSVSVPDSEVSRFNRLPEGGEMPVSAHTAALIRMSFELYGVTDGYFDPTVYPLVDLWGFSPRFRNGGGSAMPYDRAREEESGSLPAPDEKYREAFLRLVGLPGIVLTEAEDGSFLLKKGIPSVTVDGAVYPAMIDLGGIAKGYAVDLVTERMRSKGFHDGFFSCGTSSIALMNNHAEPDGMYRLAVRNPRPEDGSPESYARVLLSDASLSTSGDYDENYFVAGQRACHIIDPFLGCPLGFRDPGREGALITVTLLSGSACEDDALTTAMLLLGEEKSLGLLRRLGDRHALLVRERSADGTYAVVTDLDPARVMLTDPRFRLVPADASDPAPAG